YNPTTIDLNLHDQQKKHEAKKEIVIGWTGTHSTLKYLQEIVPIIQKLSKKYPIQFVVIANQKPDFQLDSLNFIFWTKENEIQDLLKFDIGIMPLSADRWSDGKCGFKALQYMVLGIPTLASPVGVNAKIIEDGENGFLCKNALEWEQKLVLLIENHELRAEFGMKAHQKVKKEYSVESNKKNFLNFFQ
ncbi:MAG: glycosyltransferase family 1 protein, partial [Bacteroidetes bacterium]